MISTEIILNEYRLPTPVGTVVLLTDGGDVRVLDFDDYEHRMRKLLDRQYGRKRWTIRAATEASAATSLLQAYFEGDLRAIDGIATLTGGTTFQRQVWSALRGIPAGETRSYAALARAIGSPKAVRAVGLANGANPIGIIVPCHRIIGSDGALTGYGGGIDRKRWLLDHEARYAATAAHS